MIVDWIKANIPLRFEEVDLQILTIYAVTDCRKTVQCAVS